ncbi:hypothetical protein [Paenibacillus terrigena]|uniref:hypothetical protein n=1 Tax=Paenibacillus terrigena TaxID=369333 RepID=UPI00037F2EC9|nr:hypothetical protein [Paenibacillus terrigena]
MLSALLESRDSFLERCCHLLWIADSEGRAVLLIECPVLGHYGELDPVITDKVPQFEAAMKELGKKSQSHSNVGKPDHSEAFYSVVQIKKHSATEVGNHALKR